MNKEKNVPGAKLTKALTNHGVPFATAYGPSWGPGYPEWESARKTFHVPCNCVPDVGQPVAIGFSRCSRCHGFSIHGEIPSQAPCKVCRGTFGTVCVAFCNGFHSMTQCALGKGSTKNTTMMHTNCCLCVLIAFGNGRYS